MFLSHKIHTMSKTFVQIYHRHYANKGSTIAVPFSLKKKGSTGVACQVPTLEPAGMIPERQGGFSWSDENQLGLSFEGYMKSRL